MNLLRHLTNEEKLAVEEIGERINDLVGEKLTGFYLFGSKARGDYNPESDVDLSIIVDGLTREMKRQIVDIVVDAEVKYLVVISSLILSKEDFALLQKKERRIALDIEKEGISLLQFVNNIYKGQKKETLAK